ncbi:unknown [[Mannheimia] succiniciproducens MBEL55E]|uniref:Uncharacterized protein n=1 Tax=Mannheimia succiniciproducens (strain KCTC 0769BP / MBEL55E) TaxID=221988 RepID=Q65QP2_MANSM|nr:unknown [[Mannheimia] succiniciproducens MBEL55E]
MGIPAHQSTSGEKQEIFYRLFSLLILLQILFIFLKSA